MLSKEETELVWLTKRVAEREDLIKRLNAFFEERHIHWPPGVPEHFLVDLDQMKNQLYFEATRLEKLAWTIHDERERAQGRDPAFTEGLIDDGDVTPN